MGVMEEFGVAQVPALLGLTLYVAGYGLGPILWSPMSEIPQIGRLWVYIITLCKNPRSDMASREELTYLVSSFLCVITVAYGVLSQLRYAINLPIFDWICWIASSCNRRGVHCRHVPAEETSLWTGSVGNRCSMRSCFGTLSGRICCHVKGMEVDDMGDYVAIRLLLGCAVLFPTGDQLDQHPAPPGKAIKETDW